eukprot:TRINITY_DN2072_c0_g1_i1.p1 TRINITY_DN2072_c0_g1~~TRINITY_DN2072_c0_g1_i1.p1  ORF type:complete len:364 (+),score=74.94 TRINITY_DN2072_c0_g1_i1:57-1094(+)
MNSNVLMYPYESPAPTANSNSVTSMEDALKLAKVLVQQEQVRGVKSAEEAKNIAARIMQQYLATGGSPPRSSWDTVPKATMPSSQQQYQSRSPPDYSPQLSGSSAAISNSANISKPVSPLIPTPITNENWHPESAKALEDYVDTHVNYYDRVVKPKKTFEDQLCDQLSIALYDSVYLESKPPVKPVRSKAPKESNVPRGVKVCPLLQKVCVSSHNSERVRVRYPTVQTDDELAKRAVIHADYCLRYGEVLPDPELDNVKGQNIMQFNGALVGQLTDGELLQMAMDHWMQEARSRKNMEHYSQLMWRKVSQVGAGVARGKLKAYVVCNYNVKPDMMCLSAVRSNLP